MRVSHVSNITPIVHWQWATVALIVGLLIVWSPLMGAMLLVIGGFVVVTLYEPTLALVAMLIISPMKALIETEIGATLPLDIGQIALMLAIGIWTLRRVSFAQPLHNPLHLPLFIPISLFVFATLLSVPNAYSTGAAINEWLKWVEILILIYIIADTRLIRWEWLVFGLLMAGATQSLVGLYEFRGGSGAPHLWILDFQYFRAFGTFGQPNPFGAFQGLLLPLGVGTTWGYLTDWYRNRNLKSLLSVATYAGLTAILIMGLFISWSRGAWLGFGAAGAIMVWFLPEKRWQGTVLLLLGVVVIAALMAAGMVPPQIVNRISDFSQDFTGFEDVRGVAINDDNYAVLERLAHWQAAVSMSADYPVFGVGFGNYEIAYSDYALVNWPDALGHAHNYYLNLLAEVGVLGLTVYAIMWGSVLRTTLLVLADLSTIQRGVVLGMLGTWTHLSIHSLVDKLYVNNMFLHIGVLFGILSILSQYVYDMKKSREAFID